MINQTGKGAYGYVALAHAILKKGETENDQVFLMSDWHDWLVNFCKIGDAIIERRKSNSETQVKYV